MQEFYENARFLLFLVLHVGNVLKSWKRIDHSA